MPKIIALNELAKSYKKYEISESDETKEIGLQQIDDRPNQMELVENQEINRALIEAIAQLPMDFKNAVVLSCLKELSLEEIAVIEKCSVGTVKSRIFRGKQLLRSLVYRKVEV